MTTFQNPLGTLMSSERKQALVELLTRHRVPLIEDDVYAELYFTKQRPAPAKAYDKAGLVMHCSSFSKSLAPGFRVGWAAPGRFAPEVERRKLALNLGLRCRHNWRWPHTCHAEVSTSTCGSCG